MDETATAEGVTNAAPVPRPSDEAVGGHDATGEPQHSRQTRLLALNNAHQHDARVVFDEDKHVYFIDGERYPTSVSGVVHQYFPSFDPAACVEQYYVRWKADKKSRYYQFIAYLENVLQLPPDVAKTEICSSWNASGSRASADGTSTHLAIELDLNGEAPEAHHAESAEFQQYVRWRKTHPTWVPHRTEWSVFDVETLLCGQIDSIWRDSATGKFYMVDWKRVEKLERTNNFGERGFAPLKDLHNTNLSHYTLQQNLYAWMLRRNYDMDVAGMYLLQVHPSIDEAVEVPVAFIDDEIDIIVAARKARVVAGELKTVAASALKRLRDADATVCAKRSARNGALRALYTRLLNTLQD